MQETNRKAAEEHELAALGHRRAEAAERERERRLYPAMSYVPLYPLRFDPIFETRIWGGHQLTSLYGTIPSALEPIGEAWILSDRDDHPSRVANGVLKGRTMSQLIEEWPRELFGEDSGRYRRFPLLLKFLDAEKMLSVQVHPSAARPDLIPAGETEKTEAWVVLEVGPKSRIYAGVKPGTTESDLTGSLKGGTVASHLACFAPHVGEAFLVPAGMIHSLGDDVLVFEIQQNSDVTYRLDDWGHVDANTGHARPLQVAEALACLDLSKIGVGPMRPVVDTARGQRERVLCSEYFIVWRLHGPLSCSVGLLGALRIVVCIAGTGQLEHDHFVYEVRNGDVFLLPAVTGACVFRPRGCATLLEIAIPTPRSDMKA